MTILLTDPFSAISTSGAAATGINFSADRITWTTNDVTTDHGITVRRSQKNVWLTSGANTPSLVAFSESSADGLNTWQTQYRDATTPVTSHTQSVPGTSRTVTNTLPDGSYTVSGYSYSRIASTTRYDSTGVQIGGTIYGYDPQGRQNTQTDFRNGTTTLVYNNADLVTTNITPNPGGGSPEATVTAYDQLLRPYLVTQPDNTTVNTVYLLTGEIGLQYGSRTYPVGYSYDYAGRMKTMTNWSNFAGNTGGRVTTWNYDPNRGWLAGKAYADGNGPTYNYTPAGRLYHRIWMRGITTTYGYDFAGSLNSVSYNDGVTPSVSNTYDRNGRQITAMWNGITDTMSYNLADEILGESFSGGPLAGLATSDLYDQDLRRTNLTTFNGTTAWSKTSYGYDNASRLQTANDGNNDVATYNYLANSPLVSQIGFKQDSTTRMTTTRQYDFLNRLTQVSSAPSASYTLPLTFNYNYNPANQRTKDTLADGSYWVYGYDSLGQVTNACKFFSDGTPVAGQQFDYTFDTIGNRTQTLSGGDQNGQNLRLANYSANNLNQITGRDVPGTNDVIGASVLTNAITVNGQTAYRKQEYFWQPVKINNGSAAVWTNIIVGGGLNVTGNMYVAKEPEAFLYDADGNLTNDGRWAYTWDAENRLVGMATNTLAGPAYRLSFAYDPKGRRIQKVSTTNGVTIGTYTYLYDGWNLVTELKNGALLRSYMWGNDLSGSSQGAGGVGGLLEVSYTGSATTNCFPAFDGNGNVAALVNAADGTIAANYEYGPFGEVIRQTGPMAKANPFRFSTIYQDDESDLLIYAHRPYSASLGRFLSREPLGELGANLLFNIGFMDVFGEESRLNPYWIVDNDPVHHYDILGLQSVPVSLTEAMASGNVGQVESMLAGMEEGDAGWAIAQAWLKKVAKCEALWAEYKALNCKGCSACKTREETAPKIACLALEIAGRAAYLNLKCDYCLAGSIARGSAIAEKGHQTQLAEKTAAAANCGVKALTLPSSTPPNNLQ